MKNAYQERIIDLIDDKLEHFKGRIDLPFDEIYHREKTMIDRVVKLEVDLKSALDKEVDILKEEIISIQKLYQGDEEVYESDLEYFESLKSQDGVDAAGFFDTLSTSHKTSSQFQSVGIREELEDNKRSHIVNNRQNTGYCFVTYSHSDEAKVALLTHQMNTLKGGQIDVYLKSDMDHSDFDIEYVRGRMKSDAKLIGLRDDLKKAKRDLKVFEDKFDHLPKMKRL